ncbi:Mu prophage; Portal protein [Escherichia coli]|nr:Mu prophage; Portal protein [Escherichia coli]
MLDEYLHSADWFDAMLFDATDAILKGYSCMEIEHGMLGKMHIIRAIRWRDSGHFCLNPDDLSELRLRDGKPCRGGVSAFWLDSASVTFTDRLRWRNGACQDAYLAVHFQKLFRARSGRISGGVRTADEGREIPVRGNTGAEKRPDAGGDGYRATYRRDHPGRDVAGISGRQQTVRPIHLKP